MISVSFLTFLRGGSETAFASAEEESLHRDNFVEAAAAAAERKLAGTAEEEDLRRGKKATKNRDAEAGEAESCRRRRRDSENSQIQERNSLVVRLILRYRIKTTYDSRIILKISPITAVNL